MPHYTHPRVHYGLSHPALDTAIVDTHCSVQDANLLRGLWQLLGGTHTDSTVRTTYVPRWNDPAVVSTETVNLAKGILGFAYMAPSYAKWLPGHMSFVEKEGDTLGREAHIMFDAEGGVRVRICEQALGVPQGTYRDFVGGELVVFDEDSMEVVETIVVFGEDAN